MSKENTTLAESVINSKLSTIDVVDTFNADKEQVKVCIIKVPVLYYEYQQEGDKDKAITSAVKHFAERLDSGDIVLSDTWAQDNL